MRRPEIVLGMSTVRSPAPPASLVINEVWAGVVACLEETQPLPAACHGRMLRLVALGRWAYVLPARTIPNMRRLIDQEKVLAIVGNVGTPTAIKPPP